MNERKRAKGNIKKINRLLLWCKWKVFILNIDFSIYDDILR